MFSHWVIYKLTVFFYFSYSAVKSGWLSFWEAKKKKLSCGGHSSFLNCEFNASLAESGQEIHLQIARLSGKYILEAKVISC